MISKVILEKMRSKKSASFLKGGFEIDNKIQIKKKKLKGIRITNCLNMNIKWLSLNIYNIYMADVNKNKK